jgi:arylsulfatase A-like enzyme
MKRREFIAATAAAAIGLVPKRAAWAEDGSARKNKPNIFFIMTDQQQAAMLSCAGNQWLKTPALDRLAASGIRFERAYASNPVCVPSRYSLQTGLMPSAIGMGRNEDSPQSTVTEAMVEQSLGRLLKEAGYETVYGGKVHLPKKMNRIQNLGYRNLTRNRRHGLAEACAKFIKGPHNKPFFLFASFINPHDICYMAINAFNRSKSEAPINNEDSRICESVLDEARKAADLDGFVQSHCPTLPANHAVPQAEPECITEKFLNARPFRAHARESWTDNQWRLHRWLYCRLTERVDKEIGVVLDALREAGLEKETLIVFTSDHGDMDSSHKMEHKSVLYEEATRIPFIMSYKGTIPAGKVDNTHLISNGLDLLPTLCDYAGIDVPEGRHGRSVRALAEGKRVSNWREYIAVESQDGRMVRTDRFKYCIYDSGEHAEQLTDLKNDPGEMKNLAESEEYKDILNTHRRLLRRWVERTGDKIGAGYVKS